MLGNQDTQLSFGQRIKHAWNAFREKETSTVAPYSIGVSSSSRPDRTRMSSGSEKSIVASIYNRLSVDVSDTPILHARSDQNGSYLETIDSGINYCLGMEANIDQSARSFIQDIVISMCDEGVVAVVPVDTTINPSVSASYDIQSMRTGKITQWFPRHVRVSVYNDNTGRKEEIVLPKKDVAIIENPFYSVMNEPNSVLKRLIYKLNLLDAIDEQSGSGKLDLIVQLPYAVKTTLRQAQAESRRQQIVEQLRDSQYGIAYTDATEKFTQLNRPVENNLMKQIEFLTSMLYSQLGLTTSILDGTANETTMLNYFNSTVKTILSAITSELRRKFLTKTARTQGQTIMYINNPFRLLSAAQLATIADTFTRNEILSPNDIRSVIGWRPNADKKSDELRNRNISQPVDSGSQVDSTLMEGKNNGENGV